METWISILAVIAVLGGLTLILVAFQRVNAALLRMETQRQSSERAENALLDSQLSALAAAQNAIAGRFSHAIETQTQSQSELARTVAERLQALDQRVGDSLKDTAAKTAETLGGLQTRLSVIDDAQKNIAALSGQVVSLQEILSDKQTRGAFGQERMEAIVADQLPSNLYTFQATLSNGNRPDCIIRMPNSGGVLVVDSKFPLEAFEGLKNASNEDEKKLAVARVRVDIQKHVRDITEKYIIPGETHAPALMFVPSESIYAELHASFSDLMQKARRAQVVIVSPHVFMLAINTIQSLVKDARMREQASLIQREVGALLVDVTRMSERIANLRQHFDRTNKDIGEIETSMRKISARAAAIETVELSDENRRDVRQLPAARA